MFWQLAATAVAATLPHIAGYRPLAGRAAAYVCADLACRAPVASPAELATMLDDLNKNNY